MSGESSAARRHGWNGAPPPRPAEGRPAVSRPASSRPDSGTPFDLSPRALRDGLAALRRWRELARQRRQLAELDDRLLRDIGLTRADGR
ncbi:MAG TPA: DUF1127 domain-containing protein, partial [Geminicoccaceae bacterium]|nr:DUF1127 domain-containing protein [Geminicoccaceae bacterium]